MPKFLYIFTLWLACGFMLSNAQSNTSAGDLFLRGYNLKSEAEKLEQAGDLQGALNKYQQAQTAIATVAQNYPDWQPEVVNYRLQMIERSIAKLRTQAMAAPGALTPSTSPNNNLPTPTTPQVPMAPSPIPAPAAPAPGAPSIGNPLDIINQQFNAYQQQLQEAQRQLKLYEDGYTSALRERQRAQQEIDLLKKQSADLERKLNENLQQQSTKDEAHRQELERLRHEAKMVDEMLKSRSKQFDENSKTLEALQKEKEDLVARNKELEKELEDAKKGSVPANADMKKLIAENERLKKELDGARKQVESLKAEGAKKDEEIASLRKQITGIQAELTKLRQENTNYKGQVAELTVQLKELNTNIAKADTKTAGPEASKMRQENEALRNIIMRHIRQQQRLMQAKEIVIAEMKKLEGASEVLIENLEDMTSGKVRITVDEESLFSEPELKEILSQSGGMYATLEAQSTKPAGDKTNMNGGAEDAAPGMVKAENPTNNEEATNEVANSKSTGEPLDETTLMVKAGEHLRNGDYKSAEASYEDALRVNPKNLAALTNLAGIKLHSRQFEEAEVLLQKCLVYDPQNDTALYRLGICFFQQNKLQEARLNFEKSLAQNKKNARAHHYLGIITTRQGNRDRAETEFKSALAIDPNYGDAHFNLAVLYATSTPPDWEQARKHYQSALDRGIKADPAMEKLLNDSSVISKSKLEPVKQPATAQTN